MNHHFRLDHGRVDENFPFRIQCLGLDRLDIGTINGQDGLKALALGLTKE